MSATIVGAWRVSVALPGITDAIINLTTFSADGVVLNVLGSPRPAPPGAAHKLEFYSTAVGAWDEYTPGKVNLTFETLGVDEKGAPIGSHRVSANVELTVDGNAWSGPFTLTMLDPAGKETGTIAGTVEAARMTP